MLQKILKLLMYIFTLGFSYIVNVHACVEEGKTVIVYPNAPQCCEGLKLDKQVDALGIAGVCINKQPRRHTITPDDVFGSSRK